MQGKEIRKRPDIKGETAFMNNTNKYLYKCLSCNTLSDLDLDKTKTWKGEKGQTTVRLEHHHSTSEK